MQIANDMCNWTYLANVSIIYSALKIDLNDIRRNRNFPMQHQSWMHQTENHIAIYLVWKRKLFQWYSKSQLHYNEIIVDITLIIILICVFHAVITFPIDRGLLRKARSYNIIHNLIDTSLSEKLQVKYL